MEILYTSGGETATGLIFIGGVLLVLAIFLIMLGLFVDEFGVSLIGIFVLVLAMISFKSTESPIQHEVIVKPGYVIDAQKYEVVEQRGKITVIEEREADE